jgi:hypothetical protein
MAAYSSGGFFAYWDWVAEEIVTVSTLDSQYACAMITSCCLGPEHDVGVKAILKPTESGHAVPSMDMELLVKNYGFNTETFDSQMEIIKFDTSGPVLLDENFSVGIPMDWETDFWQTSDTNNASGTIPEARVNKYWQSGGGQYYDNYIQTKPFDATGWEKILITFRWAFETYSSYGQYCNFYVKYRNNEDSPWKYLTPWDNPIGESYIGDLWEISCYGLDEEFGEGFQVMFQYIGYYYYYNNIFLDDIHVEGCNGCTEYSEIEEDITLAQGEQTTVSFPGWQPSEWQNESFQDTWETYPVHGFTIMDGDQRPSNDDKWIQLELYYPWFYDIEITEIGSPSEGRSFPAQTFDVEATITNVGQYPLCCIGIDIEIGAPLVLDTLLSEYDWPGSGPYYPGEYNGWTDEHKSINNYYGWYQSDTYYSRGDPYEACLPYSYARADYVFMSGVFDTTGYDSLQLSFLSFIDHYSGSGLYALEAGYSHDGENWIAAWHEEPSSNERYKVKVPIEGDSETTYVGFWVKGNPYYMDNWYIDNVKVEAVGLDVEWSDFMCQGDDLEPGQSRVFNFDQWTPEFLAKETTAWQVPYKACATIDVKLDHDPGNNIKVNDFELDYWHDPAIHSITSPANDGRELIWENGDPDGRNGLPGSVYYGYENLIVDDMTLDYQVTVYNGHIHLVWDSGSGIGNLDTLTMFFFEDDGDPEDCEPSQDEYARVEVTDFTERLTGDSYFGRPEVEITVDYEEVQIPAGHSWIGFQPDSVGEDIAYLLTTDNKGCEVMADIPFLEIPRWTPGSYEWGDTYDLAWQLTTYTPCGGSAVRYIQPGTQSIEAVAINWGTFPELDQTCTAEIWDYISDPQNGTKQYEDNITNIDLSTPNGGTINLTFDDFNFEYEGRYSLNLAMPDANGDDDFPENNNRRWRIGVDNTKPITEHSLYPPDPDGKNDWYIGDLEATLYAYDPLVMDVSSGADYINFRVNDGPIQTIDGDQIVIGTFLITQADDNKDVKVEYWAVDNVGNVEDSHTFYIDMDQTDPTVYLTYEVVSGNPIQGWVLEFTATATDHTSGMDRVEFFLNEVLQTVVSGSGPTYQWSFTYHGDLNIDIGADGYDIAGNFASDAVENPRPTSYNYINQNSQFKSHFQYMTNIKNNKTPVS